MKFNSVKCITKYEALATSHYNSSLSNMHENLIGLKSLVEENKTKKKPKTSAARISNMAEEILFKFRM